MKAPSIFTKFLPLVIFLTIANAGQLYSYQERVIICMVPLDYADAWQLVDVLKPFLSPQGKLGAYSPTNTLIIKDQPEVVKMLIKVIKGKADLSECQNYQNDSKAEEKIQPD
jgi:type II secretory pathway component GspD/PulD (secretin)